MQPGTLRKCGPEWNLLYTSRNNLSLLGVCMTRGRNVNFYTYIVCVKVDFWDPRGRNGVYLFRFWWLKSSDHVSPRGILAEDVLLLVLLSLAILVQRFDSGSNGLLQLNTLLKKIKYTEYKSHNNSL